MLGNLVSGCLYVFFCVCVCMCATMNSSKRLECALDLPLLERLNVALDSKLFITLALPYQYRQDNSSLVFEPWQTVKEWKLQLDYLLRLSELKAHQFCSYMEAAGFVPDICNRGLRWSLLSYTINTSPIGCNFTFIYPLVNIVIVQIFDFQLTSKMLVLKN